MRCGVLHCDAVCCSVLQCVAVCCSERVAVGVSQCVALLWRVRLLSEACPALSANSVATMDREGGLIFTGHFLQKSPIIHGSFAERDLNLRHPTHFRHPVTVVDQLSDIARFCGSLFDWHSSFLYGSILYGRAYF